MHNVTTSRHIRSATELFIMVPIKNDFVPITEVVLTYAGRVSAVLKLLGELRQQKIERGFGEPVGPIELLNTIYRVQWSVLEPFDDVKAPDGARTPQLRQPQILLTSHFDSSWETYFRALVEIGGPLLDLIFSHCEGYEGNSCKHGYEPFSEFVRRHQRPVNFLYATAPELTIDDVRYLNRLPKELLKQWPNIRTLTVPSVLAESKQRIVLPSAHDEQTRAAYRTIHALLDVRKRLFKGDGGMEVPGKLRLTDRMLFDNAVRSILKHEPDLFRLGSVLRRGAAESEVPEIELPEFREPPNEKFPDELTEAAMWIRRLVGSKPQEGISTDDRNKPAIPATVPGLPARADVLAETQGNILSGYPGIEAGRLLMFQCDDAAALRALLRKSYDAVTTEAESQSEQPRKLRRNIAVTYSGVKLLALPTALLESFPREFREGMEERAGMLGDVGFNHPAQWRLPLHRATGARIHLSTIHAVVIVLGSEKDDFEAEIAHWESSTGHTLIHVVELTSTSQPERSQPVPREDYRPRSGRDGVPAPVARDQVPLNQFLLGYENVDDVPFLDDQGRPLPRVYPSNKESAFGAQFIHGSFLAMRKMKQDDVALEAYITQVAETIRASGGAPAKDIPLDVLREDARALIIGRRKNGTLLGDIQPETAPGKALSNDFDFDKDRAGNLCPFQSHVRRTNPRTGTPLAPRIVRRGLAYASKAEGPDQSESGLVFMAYCANLARQYEIIQRYVNGANATGILSRQNDMLCGAEIENDAPRVVSLKGTSVARFVDENATITLPPRDVKAPFVSLRWGLYLFVPSKSGIHFLAEPSLQEKWVQDDKAAAEARGEARLLELEALSTRQRAFEWKRILEEVPEAGSPQARHAADIAAAITKRGGALVIPKILQDDPEDPESMLRDLVVVTTQPLALEVLSNDKLFSVSLYRERMNQAIDDHYIGYDVNEQNSPSRLTYAQLSTEPNEEFAKLREIAFQEAHAIATSVLDDPGTIELDPDGRGADDVQRSTISVRDLASAVIAQLCHNWLDMPGLAMRDGDTSPDRRSLMNSLERFLIASRYCFQVTPVPVLKEEALANLASIQEDYAKVDFVKGITRSRHSVSRALVAKLKRPAAAKSMVTQPTTVLSSLPTRTGFGVPDFCRMAVLGAVGFAPPAVGALTRILDQWIETEELWQIQSLVNAGKSEAELIAALRSRIHTAWSKTPAPPTLYRTATRHVPDFTRRDAKLVASADESHVVDIKEGARVVVNLSAVYADARERGSSELEAGAWLFGGEHGGATHSGQQTPHGCPGREAGLLALAGIITALLQRGSLRRERRFLLSYEREKLSKETPSTSA